MIVFFLFFKNVLKNCTWLKINKRKKIIGNNRSMLSMLQYQPCDAIRIPSSF